YHDHTLTTAVTLTHPQPQLSLACADVVDFDRDLFLRRFRVINTADHPREVRLFLHHDWHIGESEGANTVFYHPDLRALIAYKDRCYILVNGLTGEDPSAAGRMGDTAGQTAYGIPHWATGQKEVNGLQGTWRDAEDGVLGGNPIAQGSVDSCAGFHLGTLPPGETATCYSWLAFGSRFQVIRDLDVLVRKRGPESLFARSSN